MTNRSPTARTPRASCRVGCVVAAVLVTLGGLRLLVAAEPERRVVAATTQAVTAVTRAPWPAAVEATALRVDAHDFAAVVEQTSRRIECVPGACGFPRALAPADAEPSWDALAARVITAVPPSFEDETSVLQPAPWFPVELCTHEHVLAREREPDRSCPDRLDAPASLAARF